MLIAGLDVGGTKTLAVVVDATGSVIGEALRPTDHRGPEGVVATVKGALRDVAAAAGVEPTALAAVGIGIPGLVDPANGTLRHAVNLGIGDGPVDLVGTVDRLVGVPVAVAVANDTSMAALGAAELFGVDDLAYLSLGTGVSAGLVLRGEMRAGAHGVAGEIGHLPIDPLGPVCECGQRGCLEAVVSGTVIARRWPAAADHGVGPTAALLAAATAGDAKAVVVRNEVCGAIAWAVALLAQTFDPELVVLGGGVADAGEPLVEAARAALRARAETSPLMEALDLAERLAIVPRGVPVGALGAARAARRVAEGEGVRS